MAVSVWDIVGGVCVLGFVGALGAKLSPLADSTQAPISGQAVAGAKVQLGDEWMGLTFRGERVGYIHVAKRARDGGGVRYDFDTRFRLMAQANMHLTVGADLDAELALRRFDFQVDAGLALFEGEGVIEQDAIALTFTTGGKTDSRRIPISGPPVLKDTIGPTLSQNALAPGDRYTMTAFDPLSQSNQPVEIEVIGPDEVIVMGEARPAIRLRQTVRGVTLNAWMNDRGEMLRQELGLGLMAERETEEEARWGYVQAKAGRTAADLREATSIAVPGLGDLTRRDMLTLRIAGLPEDASIDDRRQSVKGRVLTIRRELVGAGTPLPVKAGDGLAAEPLIQSDDPKIQAADRKSVV